MLPRLAPLLALALGLATQLPALADTPPPADALQTKKSSLQVTIELDKVDLGGHKLEVKLSHPADKVRIKVFGQSGKVLAETEKAFSGAAAGTALVMSWSPSAAEDVGKIEVYGYDTDGYWKGVAITPWSAEIPHEDVNFESDSDVIRASEVPKLDASFKKITDKLADIQSKQGDLGTITLYIVGHTDTVGSVEHNLELSRKRAHAIAAWFKARGFKNPIAYDGMGKSALLVRTGDQVDEPRNRRADYVLARTPTRQLAWKTP